MSPGAVHDRQNVQLGYSHSIYRLTTRQEKEQVASGGRRGGARPHLHPVSWHGRPIIWKMTILLLPQAPFPLLYGYVLALLTLAFFDDVVDLRVPATSGTRRSERSER